MQKLSLEMKDPLMEYKFKKIMIGYDIENIQVLTGIIVTYFCLNSFFCVVIFEQQFLKEQVIQFWFILALVISVCLNSLFNPLTQKNRAKRKESQYALPTTIKPN